MFLVYPAVALLATIFTHAHAFAEAKVAILGSLLPSISQISFSDDSLIESICAPSDDVQQLELRPADELSRQDTSTGDVFQPEVASPFPTPSLPTPTLPSPTSTPDEGTLGFGFDGSTERDDGGPPIAAIVGGCAAGVVAIALVSFLIWRSVRMPVVDDDPTAQLQPHQMPEGDV